MKFQIFPFTKMLFLFIISILLISCSGPPNSNVAETTIPDSPTPLVIDQQIGNYIVELFQDKKDHIWIGTMDKGVARFDGESLVYFTQEDGLLSNTIFSIVEDKDGDLWFGSHSGASKYDGKSFTNFGESEGLPGPGCGLFIDQKGNLWAGTNKGVFSFDGTRFSPFPIPKPAIDNPRYKWEAGKIWRIMEDRQGNLWFGRDGYGACKYDPSANKEKAFTHFTQEDGLCSNNITSILEDQAGNLWFGSLSSDHPMFVNEGGLTHYDARLNAKVGQGKTFRQFPEIEGMNGQDIYNIVEAENGIIWIGATHLGVYRYDPKVKGLTKEAFTLIQESDRMDLTENWGFQSYLTDNKGEEWFGFSGGLFKFDGTSFVNITQKGILE